MKPQINHIEYPKRLRKVSVDTLRYILKDAAEAIKAMPDGPKAGFYQDEIAYASMELKRRGINNQKGR